MTVIHFLFLANSLCLLAHRVYSADQKIVVKTEKGILTVYNPKNPASPAGYPSRLILKQDLVISNKTENEEYVFSNLRSIQVDDEENIYILDWKEIKITVFDKNGEHVRTFGKKGQGPGEMNMPIRMEIAPGNNLIIDDMGNAKLIFYSLSGACQKVIPTGQRWSTIRFLFDSKGHIYGDTRIYGDRITTELIKFDSEFKPIATIASFEDKKRIPSVEQAFLTRFSFNVTRDDNLIWLITSKYELTVLNSEGKTIRRIIKDYDPVKITEEIKKRLIKEQFGMRGIPPGRIFEVPGHFPPVRYFIVDNEGRMFISTYEYEEKDDTYYLYYDVFDAEGRYIAKFSLPEREMLFVAKKNKLYCLERESEKGIPLVKRYSMIWK